MSGRERFYDGGSPASIALCDELVDLGFTPQAVGEIASKVDQIIAAALINASSFLEDRGEHRARRTFDPNLVRAQRDHREAYCPACRCTRNGGRFDVNDIDPGCETSWCPCHDEDWTEEIAS